MIETPKDKHDRLNEEALERIYPAYGRAMLNWSNVEDTLCDWFAHLSKMRESHARAVFFSARSFSGRADMISALLGLMGPKAPVLEFVQAALKKALGYSSTRNQVAHRVPLINTTDDSLHVVELHEGSGHPVGNGNPILLIHLEAIAANFGTLGRIVRSAGIVARKNVSPDDLRTQLAEYLAQLNELPNQADSKEPSRKQRGRAMQRKLAHP